MSKALKAIGFLAEAIRVTLNDHSNDHHFSFPTALSLLLLLIASLPLPVPRVGFSPRGLSGPEINTPLAPGLT